MRVINFGVDYHRPQTASCLRWSPGLELSKPCGHTPLTQGSSDSTGSDSIAGELWVGYSQLLAHKKNPLFCCNPEDFWAPENSAYTPSFTEQKVINLSD